MQLKIDHRVCLFCYYYKAQHKLGLKFRVASNYCKHSINEKYTNLIKINTHLIRKQFTSIIGDILYDLCSAKPEEEEHFKQTHLIFIKNNKLVSYSTNKKKNNLGALQSCVSLFWNNSIT